MTYITDPNDSNKTIPRGLPSRSALSSNIATVPVAGIIQKRCNCVICNNLGSYKFLYDTTASIGGTDTRGLGTAAQFSGSHWISGSVLDADSGPVTLDIQPVAWAPAAASSNSKTGDVTFIYRRNG